MWRTHKFVIYVIDVFPLKIKLYFVLKLETDQTLSPIEKAQRKASLLIEASASATTSSGTSSITTMSNGLFSSFVPGNERLDSVGKYNIIIIQH